jgi:hypothetical protein
LTPGTSRKPKTPVFVAKRLFSLETTKEYIWIFLGKKLGNVRIFFGKILIFLGKAWKNLAARPTRRSDRHRERSAAIQ